MERKASKGNNMSSLNNDLMNTLDVMNMSQQHLSEGEYSKASNEMSKDTLSDLNTIQ
jgi:hypothetical protein